MAVDKCIPVSTSCKFRSNYERKRFNGLDFSKSVPVTKQYFREECDINKIVARGVERGYLVDPLTASNRKPMFGDFTNGCDFMSVQNKIASVNNEFSMLPAYIRSRFENNPSKLLDFLSDDKNDAEAIKLGLKSPAAQAPTVESPTLAVSKPVDLDAPK